MWDLESLRFQLSDVPGGCDPAEEPRAKADAAISKAAAGTTARLPGTAWGEAMAIAGGTTAAARTPVRLPGTAWGEAMAIAGGTTAAARTPVRLPGTAWGEAMAIAAAGGTLGTTASPKAAAFVGFARLAQCQLWMGSHRSLAVLAGLVFTALGAFWRFRLRKQYKIQVHACSRAQRGVYVRLSARRGRGTCSRTWHSSAAANVAPLHKRGSLSERALAYHSAG